MDEAIRPDTLPDETQCTQTKLVRQRLHSWKVQAFEVAATASGKLLNGRLFRSFSNSRMASIQPRPKLVKRRLRNLNKIQRSDPAARLLRPFALSPGRGRAGMIALL